MTEPVGPRNTERSRERDREAAVAERASDLSRDLPEAEALVAGRDFASLPAETQDAVLDAIDADPSPEAARRLEALVGDHEFRSMDVGAQRAEVRALAAGAAVPSVDDIFRMASAQAPPRSELGLPTYVGGLAHLVEPVGGAVGAVAGAAAAILATPEAVHGAIEAHELGREWAERSNYATAYGRAFGELASGEDDPRVEPWRGDAAGVARARCAWEQLPPAERAELRALPGGEKEAFAARLREKLSERTQGGGPDE